MAYKEIVTKAVISKGKKNFVHHNQVMVNNNPSTILGCWVINHKYNGIKQGNDILINGSYDINIWYSFDNDTKTEVIKETHNYNEIVHMRDTSEYDNTTIMIRSLNDPKCVKAEIKNNYLVYQVELELGLELIGDTKVKILVDENIDDYDLIEEDKDKTIMEQIDDEIKENYLDKKD